MYISPFFRHLRTAYVAELDDLRQDTEGNDVLKHRLAARRKELGFLLNMLELSPEMVAVVFHQAFQFHQPAAMAHVLAQESEELPQWDTVRDAVRIAPWAEDLVKAVLQQPQGAWFMCVAAGLEYLLTKAEHHPAAPEAESDDDTLDNDDADQSLSSDDAGGDAKAQAEAAADWMQAQGFDAKE